jgi:hypothetical protein
LAVVGQKADSDAAVTAIGWYGLIVAGVTFVILVCLTWNMD